MFSQTPLEQMPLVLEHSSISKDINQFDLYVNPNETLVNFTFARASIGSQFGTGWAFAPETTWSVDAFTTAAQSRCALTLVNI